MTIRKATVVSLAAVALWAVPTIAGAHGGNNDPNVVHACVGNISGVVRIVGVTGSCLSAPPVVAETPVHWGIQGPAGTAGPAGTPGLNGTNGTNGIDGRDGAGATRPDGPCFDDTNRYVDCGNGTVTDTVTGLIWLKQWNCLPNSMWAPANRAAAALKHGDCGLTDKSSPGDWRLPTRDEWSATMARAYALGCFLFGSGGGPPLLTNDAGTACYGTGAGSSFPGVPRFIYWSSTALENIPEGAWTAYMENGPLSNGSKAFGNFQVWPVRGGSR